jgi:hypothetical protein
MLTTWPKDECWKRLLRRWPVFAVATIPFCWLAYTVFDLPGATLFVVIDAIFVALVLEQAG